MRLDGVISTPPQIDVNGDLNMNGHTVYNPTPGGGGGGIDVSFHNNLDEYQLIEKKSSVVGSLDASTLLDDYFYRMLHTGSGHSKFVETGNAYRNVDIEPTNLVSGTTTLAQVTGSGSIGHTMTKRGVITSYVLHNCESLNNAAISGGTMYLHIIILKNDLATIPPNAIEVGIPSITVSPPGPYQNANGNSYYKHRYFAFGKIVLKVGPEEHVSAYENIVDGIVVEPGEIVMMGLQGKYNQSGSDVGTVRGSIHIQYV